MEFTPHLTVAAVIERSGKFLLVEELIEGVAVLNQPAGHVDDCESLIDAVQRETLEETGWSFHPEHLIGLYRWRHPESGETFIRAAFTGSLGDQIHTAPPDESILATHWMDLESFRSEGWTLRSPLVTRCIDDFHSGVRYPLSLLVDL